MPEGPSTERATLMRGAAVGLLSQIVMMACGITAMAFLTRRFLPGEYAFYSTLMAMVGWFQYTISTLFGRTTIHLVASRDDWRSAAGACFRWEVGGALGLGLLLAAASPFISPILGAPGRWIAVVLAVADIPLFVAGAACIQILTGRGLYGPRAGSTVVRWLVRLGLVVAIVSAGYGIEGALVACLGASLAEIIFCRLMLSFPLFAGSLTVSEIMQFGLPLALAAMCQRFLDGIDLLALQTLVHDKVLVGSYAVANNLTILPGLVSMAISPIVLSSITRSQREKGREEAVHIAQQTLRAVFLLIPCMAILSFRSEAVVRAFSGGAYAVGGDYFRILIWGGYARLLLALISNMLTAFHRPDLPLKLFAPMVPAYLVALALGIHFAGPLGAAVAVTTVCIGGGLASFVLMMMTMKAALPVATALRGVVVSALITALLHLDPLGLSSRPLLELPIAGILALIGFLAVGEFRSADFTAIADLLPVRKPHGA